MINTIYQSNANEILFDISKRLENIVNDLNNKKEIYNIIKQLKIIINLINKIIYDNKKNTEEIKNEIKNLKKIKSFNYSPKIKIILYFIIERNFYRYQGNEMINNFQKLQLTIQKKGEKENKGIDEEDDDEDDDYEDNGFIYKTKFYISGDKYEGEFKNGKRDGIGTYYYRNGSKYVGEFKIGKKKAWYILF